MKTRNRKPMRPNETADWELRIRHFRVFYTVEMVVRAVRQLIGAYLAETAACDQAA